MARAPVDALAVADASAPLSDIVPVLESIEPVLEAVLLLESGVVEAD
jgi:hypothetical protein